MQEALHQRRLECAQSPLRLHQAAVARQYAVLQQTMAYAQRETQDQQCPDDDCCDTVFAQTIWSHSAFPL
ncbi:hypothetical protein C664_14324 [Thauera sp. 63]|nr:hypothetical protein C664_14324 [Thauera sp. 63]